MTIDNRRTRGRATKHGSGPCGCGGKCGCQTRCCDLECAERPRFFCGQLLTDADLTTMVEWTRSRLALSRYRDGWGIVCGLDVTCHAQDRGQGHGGAATGPVVYVNAGYAVDCCGNDLVVCEPIAFDLGEVCLPPDDPCDDLDSDAGGSSTTGNVGTTANGGGSTRDKCRNDLVSGLFAVDLTLHYGEELKNGQRATFRDCCPDTDPCEHSRVLERPVVLARERDLSKTAPDRGEKWEADFIDRLGERLKEIEVTMGTDPAKMADGILKLLGRYPPHYFCFLKEYACCLKDGKDELVSDWNEVRFWLYFDWLLHELKCGCPSCRSDRGVPLASVLLKRATVRGSQVCKVMRVDSSSRHRRALRMDGCRPVSQGMIDLTPYYGEPFDWAEERLRRLGIRLSESQASSGAWPPTALLSCPADRTTLTATTLADPFEVDSRLIVSFIEA